MFELSMPDLYNFSFSMYTNLLLLINYYMLTTSLVLTYIYLKSMVQSVMVWFHIREFKFLKI